MIGVDALDDKPWSMSAQAAESAGYAAGIVRYTSLTNRLGSRP